MASIILLIICHKILSVFLLVFFVFIINKIIQQNKNLYFQFVKCLANKTPSKKY